MIQLSLKFAMGEKLTPHVLLKALKKNAVLEDVELSVSAENGAVDPEDIAVTILMNSTLKKLTIHTKKFMSVTENRFGDETSVDFKMNSLVSYRFKTAFQRNNTLEELHIHGAPLPSEIIQTITASMKNNETLQSVTLVESAENKEAVENLQAVLSERRHQGKASDPHS